MNNLKNIFFHYKKTFFQRKWGSLDVKGSTKGEKHLFFYELFTERFFE